VTAREHPFVHGRLAYLQIPALDVNASAAFYKDIFGWQVRPGTAAHLSFTDATGDIILYIYVHGFDATLEKMTAAGSAVVREPYPEGDIWVATLRDPAGNVIGIWQFDPR